MRALTLQQKGKEAFAHELQTQEAKLYLKQYKWHLGLQRKHKLLGFWLEVLSSQTTYSKLVRTVLKRKEKLTKLR